LEITGLDRIDQQIVALLSANARLSFSEIGQEVGISRVSVKHRIEQMEKNGIIRGYHAAIDPLAVPKSITFTLDIEAEPQYYTEVVAQLSSSSMLHKIYGTSGKCRIFVVGAAPNSETLGTYANYLYRTTKGIREMNWQILVNTYKDTERGVDYAQYQESEHLERGREGNE
jgi:DNA-binding Lrp family transcriptional regulator